MINIINFINSRNLEYNKVFGKIEVNKKYRDYLPIPIIIYYSGLSPLIIISLLEGNLFLLIFLILLPFLCHKTYSYVLNKSIKEINSRIESPHKIIDHFLEWEEDDKIKTTHFEGRYYGIDDKGRIVLNVSGLKYSEDLVCLPTGYLKKADKVYNKSLRKKRKTSGEEN